MPFQYSLHVQNNKDEKLNIFDNHFEFIAKHDQHPRRSIAENMIKNFPKKGTIMAYINLLKRIASIVLPNFVQI